MQRNWLFEEDRMRITTYTKAKHAGQIKALFRQIYPTWDESMLALLTYDETQALHLRTKLAFESDQIIGQANVFWINPEKGIVNLGYHVNPQYQKRGVGYQLAQSLIDDLRNEVQYFVVITTTDNLAAQMLCQKLGFTTPSDEIAEMVRDTQKYQKVPNPYLRVLETAHLKNELTE